MAGAEFIKKLGRCHHPGVRPAGLKLDWAPAFPGTLLALTWAVFLSSQELEGLIQAIHNDDNKVSSTASYPVMLMHITRLALSPLLLALLGSSVQPASRLPCYPEGTPGPR